MPPIDRAVGISLFLSIGIAIVAACLALWLWYERRQRDPDLSDVDLRHFMRQDLRRISVSVALLLLAVGIPWGSRLEPRIAGRINARFFVVWLAIFVLILVLLGLALVDWLATRLYARRHFQALARERLEILRDEVKRRSLHRNERNGSGDPIGNSPA